MAVEIGCKIIVEWSGPVYNVLKRLVSIIANHINSRLPDILTHHRHGIMPGKAIVTNSAEHTNELVYSMKNHTQVDAIYLDVSKAINAVGVQLLLCYKLELMGRNPQLLKRLRDYLAERQHIANRNGSCLFHPINVSLGVG